MIILKSISNHLGTIIVSIACVALLISAVTLFHAPISDFFHSIVDKEKVMGGKLLEDLGDTDFGFPDPGASNIVNVKDFGAVGDGATDDKAAIMAAFDYAKENLPATVYFPEGEYGLLNGGMYVELPLGSSGLTVKGDGANKSTIKYLEDWQSSGSWVALRIQPESTPTSTDEYLSNITIKDLGVLDTDPAAHCKDTEKGDSSTEETHGFDLQYCKNALIKNCKVDSVGDEGIDMVYCLDSVIANNVVVNNTNANPWFKNKSTGGAISVGDGCNNIIIRNNTVTGSLPNVSNSGIVVEGFEKENYPSDITITNNIISDVNGKGIKIHASTGVIKDIIVKENTITNCTEGIHLAEGREGNNSKINLMNNDIIDCENGINVDSYGIDDLTIDGFNIQNALVGMKLNGMRTVVKNGSMTDIGARAFLLYGTDTIIENVTIDGSGISDITEPSIIATNTPNTVKLNNIIITNCKNKVGIQGVNTVNNAVIEQPEELGYQAIKAATNIIGGKLNRPISQAVSDALIDGVTIEYTNEATNKAAIYVNSTNITVQNCRIIVGDGKAIQESANADYNIYKNNTVNASITLKGANSVKENNITIE